MRRLLGYYQVFGAVAGLGVTIWAMFHDPTNLWRTLSAALVPFSVVGTAGRLMLARDRHALKWTVAAQAIQIPIVMLPALTWKCIAGAIASVTIHTSRTFLYAGVEATWIVGGRSAPPDPTIGVNVLPIIVILCAFLVRAELRKESPVAPTAIGVDPTA